MSLRRTPLKCSTPAQWAERVLGAPLQLLNDHAHLEKKAASNALELMPCFPGSGSALEWMRVLSAIACDEVRHLVTVVRLIDRRGGEMTRSHRNPYAQGLRSLVRRGQGPQEVGDRLMISALIEARSCERFLLLSRVAGDRELQKLYHSLWGSEHGHFKVFLRLARLTQGERELRERWVYLLEKESEIIQAQRPGCSMHSWI